MVLQTNPQQETRLLIGYADGTLLQWDLKTRKVIKSYILQKVLFVSNKRITTLHWVSREFVVDNDSHLNFEFWILNFISNKPQPLCACCWNNNGTKFLSGMITVSLYNFFVLWIAFFRTKNFFRFCLIMYRLWRRRTRTLDSIKTWKNATFLLYIIRSLLRHI